MQTQNGRPRHYSHRRFFSPNTQDYSHSSILADTAADTAVDTATDTAADTAAATAADTAT